MTNKKTFFIIILVALAALAVWFELHDSDEVTLPTETLEDGGFVNESRTYENAQYGFSFSYPETVTLSEFPFGVVRLAKGGDTVLETIVITSSPDTEAEIYEQFVLDEVRILCASLSSRKQECPEIKDLKSFTTENGVRGQTFYLTAITENSDGSTTTSRKGPFYTFNLSAQTPGRMSFLLISNPLGKNAEDADAALIQEISSSVNIE